MKESWEKQVDNAKKRCASTLERINKKRKDNLRKRDVIM